MSSFPLLFFAPEETTEKETSHPPMAKSLKPAIALEIRFKCMRPLPLCRALVHVIDGCSPDPLGDWSAINLELELFNPDLKDKPQVGGQRS